MPLDVRSAVISTDGKVLAAIQPHSDDIALLCGGTVAKLIQEGYTGYMIRATNDDMGDDEGEPGTVGENVLRNAIRHAPAGSQVEVALVVKDDLATITIRDEGPGVPPESLAEIFKPFYRVEKSRERSSGGLGLGLAIASRAVELHRGRMIARNANPGLVVEMELPLYRSSDWRPG